MLLKLRKPILKYTLNKSQALWLSSFKHLKLSISIEILVTKHVWPGANFTLICDVMWIKTNITCLVCMNDPIRLIWPFLSIMVKQLFWSTSESRVRLAPWNWFKPSSKIFYCTCWERADLLALVCGVYCEFVTFPLVFWVRCGTWLYRFLIFAPVLTFFILGL